MSGIGEAARDAATWSTVPTNVLLEELRRRQDDGERPECGSRGGGSYDTPAHVFALLLILVLSTLACGFPLLSRRTTTGRRQKSIIFYCQHVGTGVLLATAFVHLLPTAFESLTDPCLPYFFSQGYTALPGVVAMSSAIVVVAVESYLASRGAGHSHNHGLWDEDDEDGDGAHTHLHGEGNTGAAAGASATTMAGGSHGRARRRASDIALDDVEASESLVAGAASMGDEATSPRTNGKAAGGGSEDGDDSDLDLDVDELDPVPLAQRAPLNKSRGRADSYGGAAPQTPEERKRQLLQCVLLEAGILFHSVFIGMAISVATGPAFVVFLVAISFHQSFEGLALGSRIAAVQFPRTSVRPWLMVLAYGLTTPLGQAIGLMVHTLYDPHSMGGLLVVGFMNAVSSGLLLYAGLVQLLAEDFLTEKSFKVLHGKRRLRAFLAVVGGAVLMAAVGAFA